MITHIVDRGANPDEADSSRALCGAVGLDGCFGCEVSERTDGYDCSCSIEPPDFNYYLLGHGHEKADCADCVSTLALRAVRHARVLA